MSNLKIDKRQSVGEDLLNVLYFPSADVLFAKEDQQRRTRNMENVHASNDDLNARLKIQFEDIEGLKQIELRQWTKTETEIRTTASGHIPIHRIKSITVIK